VQPGEVHWSEEPCLFKTILGSCVSVCLWDRVRAVGGLTHFILPLAHGRTHDARYGDVAVPRLTGALRGLGCTALVAKVFGGACVLQADQKVTVGHGNIALALALLQTENIPVIARRTGGVDGIVLKFFSDTGEALVRRIGKEGLLS
jgi:chemotaxis protein CheD